MTAPLSVRLPFQGFYESLWSRLIDDEAEQFLEDIDGRYSPALVLAHKRGHDGDLLFDATDYRKGYDYLARQYVAGFAAWLAGTLDRKEVVVAFEEVSSPAYYNFETDRLFASVPLDALQEVQDRLFAEHREVFDGAVRGTFTSYDGFASFYDNDPDALAIKPLNEWDHNELGVLIGAWVEANEPGRSLDYVLYEDFYGYEDGYAAFDKAVDFQHLDDLACEWAESLDDLTDEERESLERPRCPDTLELPLGA